MGSPDQRTVVVSVDGKRAVVSPPGVTLVPLVVVVDLSVITPEPSVVCLVVVSMVPVVDGHDRRAQSSFGWWLSSRRLREHDAASSAWSAVVAARQSLIMS